MSGRRIDDHSSWMGKGSPLPRGTKSKDESSAEGVGSISKYEDTTEAIKSVQEMAKKKVNGHAMPSGHFH